MSTRGLSGTGLARLHEAMAGHVRDGHVPGLVFGLARGSDVHIDAIGAAGVGDQTPIGRDALFRITSMTRPVTAAATLLLVEDDKLALDDPVDALLPELAGRRVLRHLNGPVDGTVPAVRPVSVRDLLTFRAGFGVILAPPSEYPVLEAEEALELRSVGPPWPATPHGPDEWIRLMGTLPLMDQPGEQWRYATGSQILGVLIARASGGPVESFLQDRIFAPLGMGATGFHVPAADRDRLVPGYVDAAAGLEPFDDGDQWLRPQAFTDCGGGLVSTVEDYLAFGQMLLDGGKHGGRRILSAASVAAMTTDQLTPGQRESAGPILGGRGWGFGLSIIDPPAPPDRGPKGYGWSGGFGTVWLNDPEEGLVAVLCTQVLSTTGSPAVEPDFWTAVYGSLAA